MKYARVENNQVVDHNRDLPKNWQNFSNFYLFDNETLKEYGWYPFRFVEAPNMENSVISGSYFEIGDDEVVEYQTRRAKTEEEIQQENEYKWIEIRNKRNRLLFECDWTQLPDSPLSEEKRQEWRIYRQELRDITNYTSPDEVIWPNEPL
jgi:hypothetical protein